jgi:hypothetical protein
MVVVVSCVARDREGGVYAIGWSPVREEPGLCVSVQNKMKKKKDSIPVWGESSSLVYIVPHPSWSHVPYVGKSGGSWWGEQVYLSF